MLTFPTRCWVLLFVTQLAVSLISTNAVRYCVMLALRGAEVTELSPTTFPELLRSPTSVTLLVLAVVVATVATLLWTTALLVTAKLWLVGAPDSVGATARATAAIARTALRPSSLVAAAAMTLFAPLVGFSAITPALDGLHIPPFIGREFAKVTLTGVIWHGALAAIACLVALCLYRIVCDVSGAPHAPLLRRLARRDIVLVTVVIALLLIHSLTQDSRRGVLTGTPNWFLPVGSGGFEAAGHDFFERSIVIVLAQTVVILLVRLVARTGRPHSSKRPPLGRSGKRRPLTASLIALAVCGAGALPVTATAEAFDRPFTVLAHRGYDMGGPENTISGLEAAAAFRPDYVEVDVQQVADGTFVASHDTNLLPLGGRDTDLQTLTSAEARRIEVSMHGNSDRVPTMQEYVERARELGVPLLIELKVTGREGSDVVADMLRELDEIGRVPGTIFHSLNAPAVEEMERQSPDSLVGLTLAMHAGPLPNLTADFYVVEQSSITQEMIDEAHAQGAPVYAWTVNDSRTMRQLRNAGVDGVVTDSLPEATALRDGSSAPRADARPEFDPQGSTSSAVHGAMRANDAQSGGYGESRSASHTEGAQPRE